MRVAHHYNRIWRWHFYAGLIVLPVVLVLACTGGLYLFQQEVENFLYRDKLVLGEPYTGSINHDALIGSVQAQFPAARLQSYQPSAAVDASAQLMLTTAEGNTLTVFVHPVTHQLLGTVDESTRLMNVARQLHKNLMLGTSGRYINELVACWLIILLLSGIYLWWPRQQANRGVIIPDTSATGRSLWREFHAVPGAWMSMWILALLLTGLPWTVLWGGLLEKAAQKAGEGFPQAIFEARPQSRNLQHDHEFSMNALVQRVHQEGVHHGFKVEYPWGDQGSYAVMPLRHCEITQSVYLFLDRYSGELLDSYRWQDMGKVGRLTSYGVAFHEGRLFGIFNQMLNLLAVLTVISLCITGPVMWWKRKPSGGLGAPRSSEMAIPAPLLVTIVVLGILLPLFGVSVILIMIGEKIFCRHQG